jgi:hypothetical protein
LGFKLIVATGLYQAVAEAATTSYALYWSGLVPNGQIIKATFPLTATWESHDC